MYQQYQRFAESFVTRAGAIMLEHFHTGMDKQWKSDTTPVTAADLAINHMLITEVAAQFPGHAVKGEEESHDVAGAEFLWVCDPLDGTIPFAHGLPISVSALALVCDGVVVVAAVYDPFLKRLFSASLGGGVFLNGTPVHVSTITDYKQAVAACEMFGRAKYDTSALVKELALKEDVKLTVLCSIILPSMLVAAGEFAFTIFPNTTAHDAAVTKLIVEEAGGKVTDIFGNEQRYDQPINGLIASNGVFHDRLVVLTKELVIEQIK
jgi:myo-inositol-1(or 4)-monophosphatase